jgi:acyl carrier protein
MAATDIRSEAIWNILWDAMEGSSHDLAALKASARDDAHFIDDLGLDSLDLLEEFELNLAADDYPALSSVQAIKACLESGVATT